MESREPSGEGVVRLGDLGSTNPGEKAWIQGSLPNNIFPCISN